MARDPESTSRVTIIVTPRERFGAAKESLTSILAETESPFDLVYVSGKAPRALVRYVDAMAHKHGFRHIKVNRLLSPNEARNIGAAAATTEYVVFVDNDVFCSPAWLTHLRACADETGADVVAPLTCHGLPLHSIVHQAGGEFAPDPQAFFAEPVGKRTIVEVMHHQNDKVGDLTATFKRAETQLCEFHCVLVRKSVFDRIGPLDEGMFATKEHLDFCMSVIQAGGKVMFEPRSMVTYLFPGRHSPLTVADWPFFLVRWSPEWQRRSLKRFQDKWGLKDDGYLEEREHVLSWRHDEGISKGLLRKIPAIGGRKPVQKLGMTLLRPVLRQASRMLVAREDRKRLERT